MSAANRRRGADAERRVVRWLRENGYPDARRVLAGDGRQDSDVSFHPLISLEVKDRQASAWPTWCRQAVAQAHPGTVPVVVRRTRGVTDVGLWQVRIPLSGARAIGLRLGLVYVHAVDGEPWCEAYLSDVITAVRELDA